MIWTDSPSWMTCWNDTNSFVRAARDPKIEFVLAQHPWMENDCQLADLVLPSLTMMEVDDIGCDSLSAIFYVVFHEPRAIEPRGESKSDYEIVCAIAERFGILEEYTGGNSVDDWIKVGYETCGVAGDISFEELKEKGYFVVPHDTELPNGGKAGLLDFYEDPEGHPLTTPSGKIEFYSERLATNFPDDVERPPMPRWIPEGESHQESRDGERGKKYPLLVISNHPRWRVHSQHDDMTWLREIHTCKVVGPDGYQYEPLWIHPSDAEARGIADGEVVTDLQRARRGAGRGLGHREDQARGRLRRSRGPVGPHRARGVGPRRRHQHHHAPQHHLQERRGHGVQRLLGGGGDGPTLEALRRALSGSVQTAVPRRRRSPPGARAGRGSVTWARSWS